MSEISLAVGDGMRRMTYAELANARGISLPAARRLTLRHHWAKQTGNDGIVRVSVPLSALGKPRKSATGPDAGSDPASPTSDATSDPVSDTTRVLERAVETLREQLTIANRRADAAEQRADSAEQRTDRERDRADSAAQQLATVETELIGARVEVAGLRCKLKAASANPAPRRSWWPRVFGR